MGYASYYENINDRIADLNHRVLSPRLDSVATIARGGQTGRNEALIHEARVIEERLCNLRNELLDLATDPQVNLAFELAQARNRVEQLSARLERQDATLSEQRREQAHLREECANERRRRVEAERQRQMANRELERVVGTEPEAMERLIDRYCQSPVGAR